MKCLQIATTCSLLLLGGATFLQAQEPTEASAPDSILPTLRAELNRPAPDFSLTDTDGKTWRLASLKGQTVVLEWYNPDCPVVKRAHSDGGVLQTLGNETHKVENVTWLAINSGAPGMQGHGLERNAESRKHYSLDYPVLIDESGATGKAYQATTTPQMYIIDKHGILVYMGGHDAEKQGNLIGPAIAQALKGEKPNPQRTPNRGCSVKYPKKATLGSVVPSFALTSLDGKEYELSNLAGKIVVLEWFNPDCPVVVEAHEKGALISAAGDLTKSGDVVWLAVNSGAEGHPSTSKQSNMDKAKKWNMQHPILMDPKGTVGRMFDARVTPQMFVIDRRGVLMYQGNPGTKESPALASMITGLVRGSKVTPTETEAAGCTVKYAPKKEGEGKEKGKRGKRKRPSKVQ